MFPASLIKPTELVTVLELNQFIFSRKKKSKKQLSEPIWGKLTTLYFANVASTQVKISTNF